MTFTVNQKNPRFIKCPSARAQRGMSEKVKQRLLTQVVLATEGQTLYVPTTHIELHDAEDARKICAQLNKIVAGGNNSF